MTLTRRLAAAALLAALIAAPVRAQTYLPDGPPPNGPPPVRERQPGLALAAALINVVYLPVRMVVTLVGGELGGLVGFFTAGNVNAANDVYGLTDGSQVVTPDMLDGKERWSVSSYGY